MEDDETEEEEIDIRIANFVNRYRRPLGFIIPPLFWHFIWWSLAFRYDLFSLFPDRYFMTLTMVFGGFVAGATSEGGGAVAFPVMTMAFNIAAPIARDFSFMIQTSGMSGASFGILFMRLKIETRAIFFGSFGGVIGLLTGLHTLDRHIKPSLRKMIFVSFFFSFAVALFILNRRKKRKVFDRVQNFNAWKAAVLFVTGICGGVMTALVGSGLDILSFSMLTLLFSVSEKVTTPTSVILMAINSSVAVFWRQFIMEGIARETWEYLAVTAPIVFIMAPLGNLISSHFHRQVLAALIYVLETVALIGAFVIIRPSLTLTLVSVGMIAFAALFFLFLSWLGTKLIKTTDSNSTVSSTLPRVDKVQTNQSTAQLKENELSMARIQLRQDEQQQQGIQFQKSQF